MEDAGVLKVKIIELFLSEYTQKLELKSPFVQIKCTNIEKRTFTDVNKLVKERSKNHIPFNEVFLLQVKSKEDKILFQFRDDVNDECNVMGETIWKVKDLIKSGEKEQWYKLMTKMSDNSADQEVV